VSGEIDRTSKVMYCSVKLNSNDMPKPIFNKTESISSMIRVDHAGEYGAMRIYQGQLKATKNPETRKLISHMMEQESSHLRFFEDEMRTRSVRPTFFLPIWHHASYAMGFATSWFGFKTAMLCTEAVDSVIDRHYEDQLEDLRDNDDEVRLISRIEQYRAEELEHKDIAKEHGSTNAPLYFFSKFVIESLCRFAIMVSKKC